MSFKAKMHQLYIDFDWGSYQTPDGGAYNAPQTHSLN